MLEIPATRRWKTGLSEGEAEARLKDEGYNELPRRDRRTPLKIVLEVLREPMLALLICGGVDYLALGDWREALILLVFANLSIEVMNYWDRGLLSMAIDPGLTTGRPYIYVLYLSLIHI